MREETQLIKSGAPSAFTKYLILNKIFPGIPDANIPAGDLYQMQMQQHLETEHHNARTGFLLFGGLSAALGWTLLIVWVGLVSLADHIR